MDEHLIYNILQYNNFEYDYSILFNDKDLQHKCTFQYVKHQRDSFCELIEEHFSRLYYLHIIAGPPTQLEVDRIFASMDLHGLFRRPDYYDIGVYITLFKKFDTHALNCYLNNTPYPYEKICKHKKYKSTLLESLTLC